MSLGQTFREKERQYGLPAGYLSRTAQIESSMNPNAKNPNSSAGGLFQFIDSTARQYGLANKFDPLEATDAAARLARDNADALRRALGREPTAGELYLAHQQGSGGAARLLANPDASAASIVGGEAARLNGGAGLTAGEMAQKWTSKIDGGQGAGTLYGSAGDDDLSGGSMPQNPMPENVGGLGGLGGFVRGPAFGDWLTAVGTSLMSSGSDAPLENFGTAFANQQQLRQRRDLIDQEQAEKAEAKAKENQTLAYAEQHFPEVAEMMRVGMTGKEAVALMSQLRQGGELTADQRNFALAQKDPAFAEFIGKNKGGFRPASAEEAAAYGVTAGQIGPDNRFYPIDPPTGMTVESDGKGGVRIVQGSGGKGGGAFTEGQSKDNVYSTRARGALPTLDTYADALDSYGQKLMDADPTGVIRGNFQDSDYQVAKTAGDEFLQAILRKDTGAAITQQEQEMYGRTYLPQPGDSREVKAYKAKARQRAIAAVEAGMSPAQMVAQERGLAASGGNEPVVPGSDGGAKRRKFNPATGTIE